MDNYEKLNRIREALQIRNMKQVELCEKTGIKKSSVNNWIAQRWQPKQDAIMKMARALNVSEMWLAGYDVPMERPVEQVKADNLVPLVHRLRKDDELLKVCIGLTELSPEQLTLIHSMVTQLTLSGK